MTARIRGRVVSAESGVPLRRAQVHLTLPQGGVRFIATDNEGFFEFGGLSPGRYVLAANKTGYLWFQYGQRTPLEPGRPIELSAGQTLGEIKLPLRHGSVIVGRIADEFGEPLPDALVQVLRYQFIGGQRQLTQTGRVAQTNDIGEFRVFGLMPGEYYVSATPPASGAALRIVGGRHAAPAAQELSGVDQDESIDVGPTYYPGTASLSEAQRVIVGLGEETSVSFSLLAVRLSRISGTIVNSKGQPIAAAAITLRPSGAVPLPPRARRRELATINNGIFTIDHIASGRYVLQVQTSMAGSGTEVEFASVPISVGGDVDGLAIKTTRGARLSGRVVASGLRDGFLSMRVNALSTDVDAVPIGIPRLGIPVGPDGTFELAGLDGPVLFRIGTPRGWGLKAVRLGGIDVTDTPCDVTGAAARLEIELTNRLTVIDGTVTDKRDMPVIDYAAFVFSESAERWTAHTRFVRTARPDQEGRFRIEGLPPGRYLAIAVDYLDRSSEWDPELLERLKQDATTLTLSEGETRRLDLKLAQ